MLDENVSPAADQPDSRAVGQPLAPFSARLPFLAGISLRHGASFRLWAPVPTYQVENQSI
eukprot:1153805-Pelagomonas_calceolata.AAC.7